jgi:hypothetical protein
MLYSNIPNASTNRELMKAEQSFRTALNELHKVYAIELRNSNPEYSEYAESEIFLQAEQQLIARKTIEMAMGIIVEFEENAELTLGIKRASDVLKIYREYLAMSQEMEKRNSGAKITIPKHNRSKRRRLLIAK